MKITLTLILLYLTVALLPACKKPETKTPELKNEVTDDRNISHIKEKKFLLKK